MRTPTSWRRWRTRGVSRFARCVSRSSPARTSKPRARAARYAALPARRAHWAHCRRPSRDGAAQPAARRRPRRPRWRCADSNARCCHCAAARRVRCARSSASRPVHDETNDDLRFRRNQIRHEVMPALDDIAERDVGALIARQADLLRDDADLLDAARRSRSIPTDARALRGRTAVPSPGARSAGGSRTAIRLTPRLSIGCSRSLGARRSRPRPATGVGSSGTSSACDST